MTDQPTFDLAEPSSGVPRRTIIAGAAWTVPAVMLATATPAHAASNDLVLAFDKTSYSGTACSNITGASVAATINGVPTAGQSVTATLSKGYKFASGGTTYTNVTGSDGRLALPTISVPATGGTAEFAAVGATTTATATLTAPLSGNGLPYRIDTRWTAVPNGARVIGDRAFVDLSGNLWIDQVKKASNVTITNAVANADGGISVSWTDTSGAAWKIFRGGSATHVTTVPTGAKVMGYDTFVTSSGDLWIAGSLVASTVDSGNIVMDMDGGNIGVSWTDATGAAWMKTGTAAKVRLTAVPDGSTVVGYYSFVAPNKDLWVKGSKIASDVNVNNCMFQWDGGRVSGCWTDSTGKAWWSSNGGAPWVAWTIANNSRVIGWNTFLTSANLIVCNGSNRNSNVDPNNLVMDWDGDEAGWAYTTAATCP